MKFDDELKGEQCHCHALCQYKYLTDSVNEEYFANISNFQDLNNHLS